MPLVLVCGYPCSGKSYVAQLLKTKLEESLPNHTILIIPESCLFDEIDGTDPRCSIYADSIKERELRARHKSEVERALSQGNSKTVLFMDGPNYIKGYRYELYCMAKSFGHQQIVLHFTTPQSIAIQWNDAIGRYKDKSLFENMISRFEAPQPEQRWDNPLITVSPHEWTEHTSDEQMIQVVHQLIDAISGTKSKQVRPNKSTQLKHISSTNYLQKLDSVLQQVIDHIMRRQNAGYSVIGLPDSISAKAEKSKDDEQTISLDLTGNKHFKIADLLRHKRQFMLIQRSKFNESKHVDSLSIASGFMQYLIASIDENC